MTGNPRQLPKLTQETGGKLLHLQCWLGLQKEKKLPGAVCLGPHQFQI